MIELQKIGFIESFKRLYNLTNNKEKELQQINKRDAEVAIDEIAYEERLINNK
ncbi:MAG: hypothetical protein HWN81_11950, partial [Candidatus Lokiarchaeota archaeon]|nr:hypothetical protein [Candidatus Lokiarchaeota archaeon]